MDLHEEYFHRRKLPANLIKYQDRANLILRSREGVTTEWNWLYINIDCKQDNNHPVCYNFVVSANPVIYASADFSQFSYHHVKTLVEERWEWDQYEAGIIAWAARNAPQYVAVSSEEAIFVSWEMFLANYDSWFANFLPYRIIDLLAESFHGDVKDRIQCIKEVEEWIKNKYERVFVCWSNIRKNADPRTYADWLADVVNSIR